MRYESPTAKCLFMGKEDFHTPLSFLETSFNTAGLNIEFVGSLMGDTYKEKIVAIYYQNGRLMKKASIEADSPAQAVKDIAEAVKL